MGQYNSSTATLPSTTSGVTITFKYSSGLTDALQRMPYNVFPTTHAPKRMAHNACPTMDAVQRMP